LRGVFFSDRSPQAVVFLRDSVPREAAFRPLGTLRPERYQPFSKRDFLAVLTLGGVCMG
jgi:hypothetical protein